ncbi:hypothetical protein SLEP1_g21045 [Rubroshorea leprosula]|uniref:Uncharacterized protein n=1 Tax=Rubroshorea leprosula TaxID=152421 RepID=A0AAV5JA08_9ROSI|nr:hypothetical protein SLEP1_g21045 [Rubroshorea leprosula]
MGYPLLYQPRKVRQLLEQVTVVSQPYSDCCSGSLTLILEVSEQILSLC